MRARKFHRTFRAVQNGLAKFKIDGGKDFMISKDSDGKYRVRGCGKTFLVVGS